MNQKRIQKVVAENFPTSEAYVYAQSAINGSGEQVILALLQLRDSHDDNSLIPALSDELYDLVIEALDSVHWQDGMTDKQFSYACMVMNGFNKQSALLLSAIVHHGQSR